MMVERNVFFECWLSLKISVCFQVPEKWMDDYLKYLLEGHI